MTTGHERRGTLRYGIAGAAGVALLVVVFGGYAEHWSWLGINGHTATLWDWLHLVLLPVATVAATLWLRHRPRFGPRAQAAITGAGLAFVAVVIAGYAVPWAWTGFRGNTLWDWLNLAALPVMIAMIPVAYEVRTKWTRRHLVWLAAGVGLFGVLVLLGYLAAWRWTGFTGNTVWDWLNLLLLPLLVPTVVVPLLRPTMVARMGVTEDEPVGQPVPRPIRSDVAAPMADQPKHKPEPAPESAGSAPKSAAPVPRPAAPAPHPTAPRSAEPPGHSGRA